MTTFQSGSTVKLTANFKGTDDVAFDPDSIDSIKIYAPDQSELASYTSIDTSKTAVGEYYLNYTLPGGYNHVCHEWSYTYNGVADLIREEIPIVYK